jgi:hypothetical protein
VELVEGSCLQVTETSAAKTEAAKAGRAKSAKRMIR